MKTRRRKPANHSRGSSFDLDEAVEGIGDSIAIAKAHFVGRDNISRSNVQSAETSAEDDQIFSRAGALAPPYDPGTLCDLFEHSNSLRQNIDAYMVNIDGNGHQFDAVIDIESDDAFEHVRGALFLEALAESEINGTPPPTEFASDAEVEAKIKEMSAEMRLEKAKLDAFFRFCVLDESFISLRMKTRQDKEIMGSGFWEVLRNGEGAPAQFTHIQAYTIRLLPIDRVFTETIQKIKRAPLMYEEIAVKKRFRRYVQVFEGAKVYYKEFGDPRTISAKTGKVYGDFNQMAQVEGQDGAEVVEATEILHFAIHSPRSPYGIPRWIGTLLAVLGSRQSEEVNFLYFENKSIPPMAILVSGGRLSSNSAAKIESFLENRLKGRSNFHKVMIIEAEPSTAGALDSSSGTMKIEIVPLTGAQQKDALFQAYDERNIDKVGMSFRLPRLLRGDVRDFNRATAEAALEFAETQVFAPEREAFDWMINRKILSELGIKFWMFQSNAPTTRNPIDLAEIIVSLVSASILTPEEARELAKGIFNRDFKKIDEIWTKIPPDLLKAGILPETEEPPGTPEEEAPNPTPPTPPKTSSTTNGVPPAGKKSVGKRYTQASKDRRLRKLASDLIDLRNELRARERALAEESFNAGLDAEIEREIIKLSEDEFRELVGGE